MKTEPLRTILATFLGFFFKMKFLKIIIVTKGRRRSKRVRGKERRKRKGRKGKGVKDVR